MALQYLHYITLHVLQYKIFKLNHLLLEVKHTVQYYDFAPPSCLKRRVMRDILLHT